MLSTTKLFIHFKRKQNIWELIGTKELFVHFFLAALLTDFILLFLLVLISLFVPITCIPRYPLQRHAMLHNNTLI